MLFFKQKLSEIIQKLIRLIRGRFKSPLLLEGVGGRLYSPCTSFSTLFSGSSSHFAPCRNCFTRLPAASVERSGVNTTCMPVMLSLVVNALAERAPFEVMPILNEPKPSS